MPHNEVSLTQVMGIVNCTPDSFYGDSRYTDFRSAVETALKMEADGADWVDIGGESSRPGSSYVSAAEEIDRILPVIEGIRQHSKLPISVDTRKLPVAAAAVKAGAGLINDITALRDDPGLLDFIVEKQLPVVLMHMQGSPENMQKNPQYDDPVEEIALWLEQRASGVEEAGLPREKILLDPGIGFGKRQNDNLLLIKHLKRFGRLGYRVLLGASRKSFIGNLLGCRPEERLWGTLGVHAWGALQGASILRVHDVRETVDMIRVISAVNNAG